MAREKTGNDVLDRLYKEYDELQEKVNKLSLELGWCDENGNFEMLRKDFMDETTELENKRIKSKADSQKEREVTKTSIQLNRMRRKIREIESNLKQKAED